MYAGEQGNEHNEPTLRVIRSPCVSLIYPSAFELEAKTKTPVSNMDREKNSDTAETEKVV